jgi:hypothetical protein
MQKQCYVVLSTVTTFVEIQRALTLVCYNIRPIFPDNSVVTLDDRSSISDRGRIFLFTVKSRLDMGPTHTPIKWVLGRLSQV